MHSSGVRRPLADSLISSAVNSNCHPASGVSVVTEPIPHLLTVDEVAQVLRCSRSTVYSLVSSAKIAGLRIGSHAGGIRITADDLQAYLGTCRIEPAGHRQTTKSIKLKHLRI
jgi:excisionase family DNA binding protein